MTRLFAILVSLAMLLGWQTSAHADDLQEQLRLFAASKEAANGEDYDQAIVLMKSALALGELNILYLNLGRLYFKAGQCDEALQAYAKALTAPAAPSPPAPPAEAIFEAVEKYRGELTTGCAAQLTVECGEADTELKVGVAELACGVTLTLEPGTHVVTATRGERIQEVEVTLAPMQKVTVPVSFGVEPSAPVAAAPLTPEAPADSPGVSPWAWTLGGVGTALLIGGVGVIWTIEEDFDELEVISNTENGSLARYNVLIDRIEERRVISGVLLGVGGALVLTAGGLALWGGDADPEEASVTTFDLSPSLGGWVLTFGGRY